MTSRDTSVDVTLDNANEGIMSRDQFERYANEKGIWASDRALYFQYWEAGEKSCQPEIDALKAENERLHTRYRDELIVIAEIQAELSRFKAENERLRKELNDFSTTVKEE